MASTSTTADSPPARHGSWSLSADSDGKSDDSRRTLALDPVTVDALREYLRGWDERKREFGHDGQHLFCHPTAGSSTPTPSPSGSRG